MNKPGISVGVSYQDYEREPGLRSHVLTDMRRSPMHCRYNLDHPREASDAMVLGEATHAAVLEPERFKKQYAARPDNDPKEPWSSEHKNSNAYKEGRALWDAKHDKAVILSAPEFDACAAMRDAAWAHPMAKRLLGGKGANEVVVLWDDPCEIRCKARLDRIVEYEGHTVIVDVKTCKDASAGAFSRACANYGYHLQGAWYQRGLYVLEPRDRPFYIIAIENTPPHCVAVYRMEKEALVAGWDIMQRLCYEYVECEKTGLWPGYGNEVEVLYLPKWAYFDEGEERD